MLRIGDYVGFIYSKVSKTIGSDWQQKFKQETSSFQDSCDERPTIEDEVLFFKSDEESVHAQVYKFVEEVFGLDAFSYHHLVELKNRRNSQAHDSNFLPQFWTAQEAQETTAKDLEQARSLLLPDNAVFLESLEKFFEGLRRWVDHNRRTKRSSK
eukprot:TRINITY_DN1733_c0_g1_i4.p1 TRINITY_DN1733_c0_g1~~TRINITY_DN1733_c0_g1_i4.p1  ORF type:complete len:155 (+),score=42.30 TRINITY_DN1733_c0_g1_i4:535-999(+)